MKNTYLETTEKTTKLIMTHCEKGETLKLITGINKIISEVINKIREETIREERKRIYCYVEEMLIGSDNELLKKLSNIIFDKIN